MSETTSERLFSANLQHYLALLENFSETELDELVGCAAQDVLFRDPFNHCRGVAPFRAVFADILKQLDDVRFIVSTVAWSKVSATALVTWRLEARFAALSGRAWSVDGCSEIRFAADGKVAAHIDYWDAAQHFYEQLPLVGRLLKYLRRRISVKQSISLD